MASACALLAAPAVAEVCIGRTAINVTLSVMPRGGGPLHDAVIAGSLPKVEQALRSGIDVDKLDNGGATPLFHAVGLGHNEIARFLIAHGANVKARDNGHLRLCILPRSAAIRKW
jgi:ankyrin repeat protein